MRSSSSILFVVLLGLGGSQDAHATTYHELCSSVPGQCHITGPNAPVLAANVCWSRTTSVARIMTGSSCPTGSWPYFVKYGIVDPFTGIVTGFVPVDDACSRPGLCMPGYLAPPSTWEAPMCCIGGTCYPVDGTNGCEGGELLFCTDGATNEDGTISCFDETTA